MHEQKIHASWAREGLIGMRAETNSFLSSPPLSPNLDPDHT